MMSALTKICKVHLLMQRDACINVINMSQFSLTEFVTKNVDKICTIIVTNCYIIIMIYDNHNGCQML